jgi:hypothetical protein
MKKIFDIYIILILCIAILFTYSEANAQVSTVYSFGLNSSAYSALTGATQLASGTGATMDDALYTGVPIGFTFKFNNVNYTNVGVSTNGFIWFGTNDPLSTTYTPLTYAGSLDGAISVFGRDLIGCPPPVTSGHTPTLRYVTSGTAPNRIFTIEWYCVRAKTYTAGTGLCASFGFSNINRMDLQIRLYESQSNRIDIHNNIAPYCLDGSFSAQVGLRGNVNTDYNNRLVTCSGNSWSAPAVGVANSSTCTISETPSCYPTATTVFTWAPPPPPTPIQCDYSFNYSTSTAYSALPASGPTTLITGTTANSFRYGIWPNQLLGFNFVYNGQNYNEVGVCSKGYIWFGSTNPTGGGTASLSPLTLALNSTSAIEGIVAGLNSDWVGRGFSTNSGGSAGGAIRTNLTGVAPNRVYTIEWSNVRPSSASDGTSGNPNLRRTDFQISLYETSNRIEVAFNINPYPYTSYTQTFQCGLRANTNTNTHVRVVASGSGSSGWANSTLGISSSTVTVAVSGSTYPATNARYIFTPIGATVTCTWNGSLSNDWHTAANWTPAIVPGICNHAVIPVIGSGVYPQIGLSTNNDAFCRNLTINAGATMNTLTGYTGILSVYGNIINNGMIIVEGNNPIQLNGGLNKTISGAGNYTLSKLMLGENSEYRLLNNLTGILSSILEINISSGSVLNLNGFNLTVYALNQIGILRQGSGTLSIEGPSIAVSLNGTTFDPQTGTTFFSSGNTWGPANQLVPSLAYHHLKIRTNNLNTVTMGSNADFSCNNLDIINPDLSGGIVSTAYNLITAGNVSVGQLPDDGVKLILNHCIYRTAGIGAWSMGDSDDNQILITKPTSVGPNNAALQGYGSLTFYGTVQYDSNLPQVALGATYKHLEILGGNGERTINGPLTVNGNLVISSGILNASAGAHPISVAGNWINTASFIHNGNTVNFNGIIPQNIQAGNSPFYNLSVNGSSLQLLINDLQINNNLQLTQGVVNTGSNRVIVLNNASSAIQAGGSNTNYAISWINGTLRRYINNGGSQAYEFPIGLASGVKPGIINTTDLAGVSYLDSWFRPLANHDNADMNLSETGIIGNPNALPYFAVHSGGCWVFEPDAQPTGGTYNIQLFFNGFSGLQNNRFGIVKRPVNASNALEWTTGGGALNSANGAGRTLAGGYALRLNLSTFSEFGIGQFNGTSLPVQLTQFTGVAASEGNRLAWTTSSELNSSYFIIERSYDAMNFSAIGKQEAKGFSQTTSDYRFLDKDYSSIQYYRLQCVDLDGSYRYSDIIPVKRATDYTKDIVVYPNPTSVYLNIVIHSSESSLYQIAIIDILGKTHIAQTVHVSEGLNHITIYVDNLPKGVYQVELINASEVSLKSFIKN